MAGAKSIRLLALAARTYFTTLAAAAPPNIRQTSTLAWSPWIATSKSVGYEWMIPQSSFRCPAARPDSDDVARGAVESGRNLTLFLPAYKEYDIRLKPRGGQVSSFETGPKVVTLYPGNVAKVEWNVTPLVIMFGRAVDAGGRPIVNAKITGPHGLGLTDDDGYFQIEARPADLLKVVDRTGASCSVTFGGTRPTKGYMVAGEVMCR